LRRDYSIVLLSSGMKRSGIKRFKHPAWSAVACASLIGSSAVSFAADLVARLKAPPGFEVSLFAEVRAPRQLASGPDGLVFVGTSGPGKVLALRDADGDGVAEQTWTIAKGLDRPAGVVWRDDALYIGEVTRISRIRGLAQSLESPPAAETVLSGLPEMRGHAVKYLALDAEGALYLPVGVPCNICEPDSPHGEILRLAPGATQAKSWARGLRNSAGLAFHPETGDLWFTDNGRDWLGDDLPSCELNRATGPGQHFGYPWRHGLAVEDPEFGSRRPSDQQLTPPVFELGAHVAPLGLAFHSGKGLPAAYRNTLFIAEHGSWNRSRKSGYRVVRVVLDAAGEKVIQHEPFLTGWLQGQEAWGTPADVLVLPDGSLLVSDDSSHRIFRITYRGD